MQKAKYDKTSADSIYEYSKKLINRTLRDFISSGDVTLNVKKKGELGVLVEKYFFGLEVNNKSEADFKYAGLELKTTGLKKLKRGGFTPKERLVLGMIDYKTVVKESFEASHLLDKIGLMLLLFYIYDSNKPTIDQIFLKSVLWKLDKKDFKIMRNDWEIIIKKIRAGKAHELSESDTLYLGACTKSATSRNLTKQPNSDILAKPRAFAFKQSYLKSIFLDNNTHEMEAILNNSLDVKKVVSDRLSSYVGEKFETLYSKFGLGLKPDTKNLRQLLVYRMLGVKTRKIEEFEKAGIITKVIRLETDGKIRESISFPAFKYTEIANQEWEESDFKNVVESKFLFIVFKKNPDGEIFQGFQLWSMPYADRLESEKTWQDTKVRILNGSTNFPTLKETNVAHVRPHARNKLDVDVYPNGLVSVKKSFWLNSKYIQSQINL